MVALLLVVGIRFWNAGTPTPDTHAPVSDQAPAAVAGPDVDLLPTTDIVPVGSVDTSDTDRRIEFWRERLRVQPHSEHAWIFLGDLFDLKGRQTGDVSQFVAAQDAYTNAIAIAPRNSDAHAGAAHILATLHDFPAALAEATTVLELDPGSDSALAVVFDASVELGDTDNARRALELLAQRVPSPAVTVRQARLAFLDGDAAAAAQLADDAAAESVGQADPPASVALYEFTAGEYHMLAGDPDAAQARYEDALLALPGYPLAIVGEGRVAFARGDLATATERFESAVAALPRPDLLAFLGDLYLLTGDTAAADDQYATIEFIADMSAASGERVYDREYTLFLADHGRDIGLAVERAQADIAQRQDVFAYDTLAWALHASGRHEEALEASRQALGLGMVDARLLVHAGLIELANGLSAEGTAHLEQALALRPAFSPLVLQSASEALSR